MLDRTSPLHHCINKPKRPEKLLMLWLENAGYSQWHALRSGIADGCPRHVVGRIGFMRKELILSAGEVL